MKSKRCRMVFSAPKAFQFSLIIYQPLSSIFSEAFIFLGLFLKKALTISLGNTSDYKLLLHPIFCIRHVLRFACLSKKLERETRLELATFSLEG